MKTGPKNCITDVSGIKVGHAQDTKLMSGTTVIIPDTSAVAAVDCRGGAPGTRETDVLHFANLVEEIHAVVLSGGSTMGLDAASGASAWLKKNGRGFSVADGLSVPIVPAAILFDLLNGGDKSKIDEQTYFDFGKRAAANASSECPLGNVGAGTGAKAGVHKGGIGTSSLINKRSGKSKKNVYTVGVLVAVNSFGSVTMPNCEDFWAWPFERGDEYGGRGVPVLIKGSEHGKDLQKISELPLDFDFESPFWQSTISSLLDDPVDETKYRNISLNTTLCVIATDAVLTKAQAQRVAIMAHDGFARAIRPVHTPFDGDIVFVLSTGKIRLSSQPSIDIARLGMMAADCTARAITRGVYAADSLGKWSSYQDSIKQ